MNTWFEDERVQQAEVDIFRAERLERRGQIDDALGLYRAAAERLLPVAFSVGPGFPNTRGDLALAAIHAFARAGERRKACALAGRFLAETFLLNAEGIEHLRQVVAELSDEGPSNRPSPGPTPRDILRRSFQRRRAA